MPYMIIDYFGKATKAACDGNCNKAWGINNRPRVQLSADDNDYAFLADGELGDAPADPGTYEGPCGKPTSSAYFPNKWCIRECERCAKSAPGEFLEMPALPDFSKRRNNIVIEEVEF